MSQRIVISGLGVICSNAIGRENFFEAIFRGGSGIKPVSLFDTAALKVKTAGEVKGFDAVGFLGSKGLRVLDRSIKLVASAAKLALDDAGLDFSNADTEDVGVVIGASLGGIHSICEFHRDATKEGPQYVNPALFPNTVINSPASQVSIKFNLKGFNVTISTGSSASLDAIKYALDFLRLQRARIVLAGGVEELCIETFFALYKIGALAGITGVELSCPFDKRRNGFIFGEGAGILVLETLESAKSRNAHIYAEVLGFGWGYGSYRQGLKKAITRALGEAGLRPSDIDYICAGANSTKVGDTIEEKTIKDIFNDKPYVSSVKCMVGECFSATGAFQAASGIGAIDKQMIPATINCENKDSVCGRNYVFNKVQPAKVDKVLINSFGPAASSSSLIISKFAG
jgi:3-oxoacyl-[acyl-carrier-protein] synthase II